MVNVANCADVDMGLFALELAPGGSDGEAADLGGFGGGCGVVK